MLNVAMLLCVLASFLAMCAALAPILALPALAFMACAFSIVRDMPR